MTQWRLMKSFQVGASEEEFWKALDIFIKRPHIVNRRLTGAEILGKVNIENDVQLECIRNFVSSSKNDENILCNLLKNKFHLLRLEECNGKQPVVAIIRKLLPKTPAVHQSFEVVVNDHNKNHSSFFNTSARNGFTPNFSYAFSFGENQFHIWVEEDVEMSNASYQWIVCKLVPKLLKWMESVKEDEVDHVGSLRLVLVSEYTSLYSKLKNTYGKQLVEIWPENTDPLKFVYEDIGIATYLLLLWAGRPKQRFIDLGCGNGLLVHILNSEGHLGIGYDLRARKIWSLYPPSTRLKVQAIVPSPETVFPDTDWLIGNHSDELTVWIPVMAARSSYSCNFFLLPCCPYEFDGRKYCRVNTSVSQYSDFLSYVETVCGECGIVVERDKLRIPSTKRTCFVGSKRTYSECEWKNNLGKLQEFVDSKCGFQNEKCDNTVGGPQFKVRTEERVRNCTQIQTDIRESIVNLVAEQLLAKRRNCGEGKTFGGIVDIGSLAKIIPSETLKKLKHECGGLQTLLKNHHYIFKVQSGKVQFRVPTEKLESNSSVWKKKPCWFFQNHPNSCPLADDKCSFIHKI